MTYMMMWALLAAIALFAQQAGATFHTFVIDELYSNADGTVQYVELREAQGANGQNLFAGQPLTSTHAGVTKSLAFPGNLPSGSTASRKVLIATQGFAALKVVTPDYVVPNGFLAVDGGTVNFAGVDQFTYASMPVDGVSALSRSGMSVANSATNFAGVSGVVPSATAPAPIIPQGGNWWNPAESGTGYAIDTRHGVLVLTAYSFNVDGSPAWYLAAGPIVNNVATLTLDKYRGGQCISCAYNGRPTLLGNDGTVVVTFTSPSTATMSLPGGRSFTIVPVDF